MSEVASAQKRNITGTAKKGLTISDILLVGILLAAGAVLKFFVGAFFTAGMKPNFIIAMYCLAIVLIRPRFFEAAIIGILAGVVCQFFPGTAYINIASELVGAIVMYLLLLIPIRGKILNFSVRPLVTTFIATICSGFTFLGMLYLLFYAGVNVKTMPVAAFVGIILGTAIVNAIIVAVLHLPIKLALGKKVADDSVS